MAGVCAAMVGVVDGELARVVAEQRGFFYRWQALSCGYSPAEIARLLRSKAWQPIRRGAYASRELLTTLDAAGRHVLLVRAVVGNLRGQVVVTDMSALAVLGVPLWGVDLTEVHVDREPGTTSRTDAKVVHHCNAIPESRIVDVDGLLVSIPELSVLDAARRLPFEAAVVLADGAKHRLPFDDALAKEILEGRRDWVGAVRASRVLSFSDGDAETVGESRSRVMISRLGLPTPKLQKTFHRADGTQFARTDFYFEQDRTVGEFDGKQKYGREMYEKTGSLESVDLGEIVWREKRREDEIRGNGEEVVRWVWSELDSRDRMMRARFDEAFGRASRHGTAGGPRSS